MVTRAAMPAEVLVSAVPPRVVGILLSMEHDMTHRTDETPGEYVTAEDTAEDTADAPEMLGKGYDSPAETKIISVLSGFTPAPDVLIKRYGFVTALVWGRIWRYCQMEEGVCRARLEKIAEEIAVSGRTVIRHIDPLVNDGYLKDLTPDLRNKPHIYVDTGKIRIRISVDATMTESHGRVTESHPQSDRESHEESIKKQFKKQKIKEGASAKPPTPPEVKLFREVTRRYPHSANFEMVVDSIGKVRARLERDVTADDLKPFYSFWTSKGYNPLNLAWLEWAETGQTPANGTWRPVKYKLDEPKGFQGIRDFLQMDGVINE